MLQNFTAKLGWVDIQGSSIECNNSIGIKNWVALNVRASQIEEPCNLIQCRDDGTIDILGLEFFAKGTQLILMADSYE